MSGKEKSKGRHASEENPSCYPLKGVGTAQVQGGLLAAALGARRLGSSLRPRQLGETTGCSSAALPGESWGASAGACGAAGQSRKSLVQGRRVKHLVKAQAFLMGTAEACLESLSVLVLEPEPLTVTPNSIFSQGRSSAAEGDGQIGAAQLGYHFALLQLCTLASLKEQPHTACTWPQGL